MKVSGLKMCLQQFINNVGNGCIAEWESVEDGLGFDAMLSHDVVKFLITDHSIVKPLTQKVILKPDAVSALDEYELAMV